MVIEKILKEKGYVIFMMPEIYDKLIHPGNHSAINRRDAEVLYSFLKKNKLKNTLEIGLCWGFSAAHIISATKSKHIAIDPRPRTGEHPGVENLKRLGLNEFLQFERDFSYNVLPRLLKEGLKIDFAFIDGNHLFDYVFLDFFYIDLLLNEGGYVLFHDNWMRATQLVEKWILTNKKNYKVMRLETEGTHMTLFQKKGEYHRDWYHFVEFND